MISMRRDTLTAWRSATLARPGIPLPLLVDTLAAAMASVCLVILAVQPWLAAMESSVFDKRKAAAFHLQGGLYFQETNLEGAEYAWRKAEKLDPGMAMRCIFRSMAGRAWCAGRVPSAP